MAMLVIVLFLINEWLLSGSILLVFLLSKLLDFGDDREHFIYWSFQQVMLQ
jgi:hypothetical protein